MAVFTYAARDDAGTLVQGDVTATSRDEAARMLRSEGKFIVRVEPKTAAGVRVRSKSAPASRGGKFNPADLIFFTNQMAVMVDTGVSLSESLEASVHEGNSPAFAKALETVIEQINAGTEFSAALAEHPKIFPDLYVSLIKASEASGKMGPILERLAVYLERRHELRKKLKGAITYPIVMCLFALGTTIFLVSYVLPKFAKIYAGREDALPAITKALLGFSDFIVAYGLYILAAVLPAAVGLYYYIRTPAGRVKFEKFQLAIPLIGPLLHKTYLARSLHTLGTMIQSGVSMLDSVQLTINVCGSRVYEQMWRDVTERVERGQQISEALADNKNVPKSILKMIGAGERSGRIGMVMERAAGFSEAELNIAIKTLTSLIEPTIVAFLGVVVGGLVIALLLPIFTISKAL